MQLPLKHILAEVRPTLQSVNVYAIFSENIGAQCVVELTIHGFDLICGIKKHQLQFYDGMEKENLIVLAARKNYLVFRFSISKASIRGCLKAEVLNLESGIEKLRVNDVAADGVREIKCWNGCILNHQDIKRAFKSPHFDYEPNEWFCHAHNVPDYSVKPNLYELQITDNGYYLDKKMVDVRVNNVDKLLTCRECFAYLGKEIFDGIYKFYPDTVYTCSDLESLQIDKLSLKTKAVSPKTLTDAGTSKMDVSSDTDAASTEHTNNHLSLTSTLRIIRDGADRNLGKVILTCYTPKSKQKEYILIWVIEKDLLTYHMYEEGTLRSKYVNKVLFQYEDSFTATVDQWCKDFNTVLIDISPSMMKATVKHFDEMNSVIPEEYGSANGFCVSFF